MVNRPKNPKSEIRRETVFNKLTVEDIDLAGKKVLMRVDFNVPLQQGQVVDDYKIKAALPTINYCLQQGASLILMSHLGRPKGRECDKYSLMPAAKRLGELLNQEVLMISDCVGEEARRELEEMAPGGVALLENLRFYEEEEKNDPAFSQELAALADLYVNDAFGTAHRAHASTVGVTKYFAQAAAGFLMKSEFEHMETVRTDPERPLVAIIGGAKISTKLKEIKILLTKVDTLLLGGGMSFTFLKAQGMPVGNSLVEEDMIEEAGLILEQAKERGVPLVFPFDSVIVRSIDSPAERRIVPEDGILEGWIGVDIGPVTITEFGQVIQEARTIIWNGPVGIFEVPEFARGTEEIARLVANCSAKSIVGGGESAAAIIKLGLQDKISHISTGGGASLEFLEGKELPGITALTDK
ncbi:MAG: phosphoglycerate kinase [bacterium]